MALKVTELFSFGGVDSRSNPVNYPPDRALRVRNFMLTRDGHLRLRDGYAAVNMTLSASGLVHSMITFKALGGSRFVVFAQGANLKVISLDT